MNCSRFPLHCLLLFLIALNWGCSETPVKHLGPPSKLNEPKRITVTSDTTQSYILYLPLAYPEGKDWPVILLFDPHSNGSVAIEKFKATAEALGYILAASNNAGNGVPNTNQIAAKLL